MSDTAPNDDDILEDIIDAVVNADRSRALALAVGAHESGIEHPLVLVLASEALETNGDLDRALRLLTQASEAAPADAETWRRKANILTRLNRRTEALDAFRRAADLAPRADAIQAAAGAACVRAGDLEGAQAYYARAAIAAPGNPAHFAAQASLAVRRGQSAEAKSLAERALAIDPALLPAHMALARVEIADEDPARAFERLNALAANPQLDDSVRIAVLDLRADACDALDRTDEAFADYTERNRLIQHRHAADYSELAGGGQAAQARRLLQDFRAVEPSAWSRAPFEPAPGTDRPFSHAFILGFPRSGTTLLEKALASHPKVLTLEEEDFLGPIAAPWIADRAALDRLGAMSSAEANACRLAYWRGVRTHCEAQGQPLAGKVFVDKLPLHTLVLPVIAKLFPNARILFALRDPRDVVLSCFRRRFEINAAMYELLSIEGAAAFYDAVMSLAQLYRSRLRLAFRDIRHETLVDDFEGETREVLNFLGLGWDPAVWDFPRRARARARTPSDEQLAGGLSREGMGQWRRYRNAMAPVLPLLRPWVEYYGYPVD